MTLDTASAREALWDAIATKASTDAIDSLMSTYADAIREQTYEEARDTVRRIMDQSEQAISSPTSIITPTLRIFAQWCIVAIGRDDQ